MDIIRDISGCTGLPEGAEGGGCPGVERSVLGVSRGESHALGTPCSFADARACPRYLRPRTPLLRQRRPRLAQRPAAPAACEAARVPPGLARGRRASRQASVSWLGEGVACREVGEQVSLVARRGAAQSFGNVMRTDRKPPGKDDRAHRASRSLRSFCISSLAADSRAANSFSRMTLPSAISRSSDSRRISSFCHFPCSMMACLDRSCRPAATPPGESRLLLTRPSQPRQDKSRTREGGRAAKEQRARAIQSGV